MTRISHGNAETRITPPGTEKLQQRLEQVETRVAALEQKLAEEKREREKLEQRLAEALTNRPGRVVPVPQGLPRAEPGVPPHCKRGEINGIPYSIVPLDDAGNRE